MSTGASAPGSGAEPTPGAAAGSAMAPGPAEVEAASETYLSDETLPVLEGSTRLVLVRHGVTDFTQAHRMDGRGGADPALNATGRAQARAASGAVAELLGRSVSAPVRVVSSSLARARETGQLLAQRLGVEREEDRDWDEQGFGDWDGRAMPELAAREPRELVRLRTDLDYARPGGESRRDLDARVGAALGRAVAAGGTVVVATHRVAIMSVLCRVLGVEHDRGWSIATGPASLSAVEMWPDGGVQVTFVNDTHHLRGLA
ncbi:histidine phosphatase family protein [uncultured Serinicoccus sp.]|uniref:histidine phosphatase family protein n=1 Tax=uncultured Serinicoccus sp. TaxID=735514 RepID=UPI002633880B|nr:histidine phosphatase family protein [uncultured Serinicoccus sp.]